MKVPRDLSGRELIHALCSKWGYRQVNQEGSHVILQSESPHHRIAVPDHQQLRIGTLNAILRKIAEVKGIDRGKIIDSV